MDNSLKRTEKYGKNCKHKVPLLIEVFKTSQKQVNSQKVKWKTSWLIQTLTQSITLQKKFPRLEVQAYRLNEILSVDVAYMNKIAKFNNGVRYLLVAVDVLSRF